MERLTPTRRNEFRRMVGHIQSEELVSFKGFFPIYFTFKQDQCLSFNDALNFGHEGVHAGFQPHFDSILVDIALELGEGRQPFELTPDGRPISSVVGGAQEPIAHLVDLAFY